MNVQLALYKAIVYIYIRSNNEILSLLSGLRYAKD
jgi:hypothetical protein